MNEHPSGNGSEGRDPKTGQFIKGWKGGPGNPVARRAAEYHRAIRDAVSPDAVVQITKVLVDKALAGDVQAAREVLDRVLGKAKVAVEVEHRSESIEQMRARLLSMLAADPNSMHRMLGIAPPKALPSRPRPTD